MFSSSVWWSSLSSSSTSSSSSNSSTADSANAFQLLVTAVTHDAAYHSTPDRVRRARHLLDRYGAEIRYLFELYRRQCDDHQQKVAKSPRGSERLGKLLAAYRRCWREVSRANGSSDQRQQQAVFRTLVDCSNALLLRLPQNTGGQSSVCWESITMFRIYARRAVMGLELKLELELEQPLDSAHWIRFDLRNALSVLDMMGVSSSALVAHFQRSEADRTLLLDLVRVASEVLPQLSKEEKEEEKEEEESGGHTFRAGIFEKLFGIFDASRFTTATEAVAESTVRSYLAITALVRELLDSYLELKCPVNQTSGNFPKVELAFDSPEVGRYYRAVGHISKGDTILMDRPPPAMVVTFREHFRAYCGGCHRRLLPETFWPCGGCTELVYCGRKCAHDSWEDYHRHECGIYGLLLSGFGARDNFFLLPHVFRWWAWFGPELMTAKEEEAEAKVAGKLPENFTLARAYLEHQNSSGETSRKEQCVAFTSLEAHRLHRAGFREDFLALSALPVAYALAHRGLLPGKFLTADNYPELFSRTLEHLTTGLFRVSTNGFCWSRLPFEDGDGKVSVSVASGKFPDTRDKVASVVALAAAFFNHSCAPNAEWAVSEGGVVRVTASEAIAPGFPVTLSYGPRRCRQMALVERASVLRDHYCFRCRCAACRWEAALREDAFKCPNCLRGPLVGDLGYCVRCGWQCPEAILARIRRQLSVESRKLEWILSLGIATTGTLEDDTHEQEQWFSLGKFRKFVRKLRETEKVPESEVLRKLTEGFQNVAVYLYAGSFRMLELCSVVLNSVVDQFEERESDAQQSECVDALLESVASIIPVALENIIPEVLDSVEQKTQVVQCLAALVDGFNALIERKHDKELSVDFCNVFSNNLEEPMCVGHNLDSENSGKQHQSFCPLFSDLNRKLADVLQYDLERCGQLFPVLHRKWTDAASGKEPEVEMIGGGGGGDQVGLEEQRLAQVLRRCIESSHNGGYSE